MKRFFFKAKDRKTAKTTSGEVEAKDEASAARLLREKGLIVISLKTTDNPFSSFSSIKNNVSHTETVAFTRQLATMITAGLPIAQALLILKNQSKGPIAKVISQILADIEGGESVSSALSKHPTVFSPTYIALIKSGETGGVLDTVLQRLAESMEKQQEFKAKVKGALIYPIIIVVGMVVVIIIMMIFVVPKVTSLYSEFNADLPIITRGLMAVSAFMVRFWPILAGLLFAGFAIFRSYIKTKNGKRKLDEFIFKLPLIGDLSKQIILTELTSTMSLMVGAGVSILDSLSITSSVVGNSVISDALKDANSQVEKGFSLSFVFAKHPEAFPVILSQMVSVGEETGKMDEILSKISHVFEMESEQKVKGLLSAIEPMIMVVLGVGVGFLVIAIIMPIYNITNSL